MSPRVWLSKSRPFIVLYWSDLHYPPSVTGTSTGFGRQTAEFLLKKGDIVVATARHPEVLDDLKTLYPATQLITVKLDVTKVGDIGNAFAKAKEAFGCVDVVFNNAGWSPVAEIEAHPEGEARKMFDTNFWGSTNVSREAVRFFREDNTPSGGLLLVNSSMSGIRSVPIMGYYSASKHGTLASWPYSNAT